MACYDNIIGLSRADCPCIEAAPADGYNTSTSGLYLTDLEPLDNLTGYSECGVSSIWNVLSNVRDEAVRVFKADTNALLAQYFAPRRERFIGQIGEATGRDVYSTDKTYSGVRLACNPMRGGTMKIKAIGTLFSGAGTLSISVYNSLNVRVVAPFNVTVANGWTLNTLATEIELPLYVDFDSRHEYFLVYTFDADNPAKLNSLSCGCGGFLPYYNRDNPMWYNTYGGNKAWANWLMVGGWSGDTLTDFDQCNAVTETRMNGLALQVELGCDVSQILCNGTLDFTNDLLAMSAAYAILWKAGDLMAAKLLMTTDLNRQNVINRDVLKDARKEWQAKYVDATRYISEQAAIGQNDCLTCREDRMIGVKTAFS